MRIVNLSRYIGKCATIIAANAVLISAVHAQTLGANLALTGPSAGADGSGFSNTKLVRDGSTATYTQASGTSNQRVSVKWGSAINFNTVVLRESGSNIGSWQLVNNDNGAVLASGTGIGATRTVNLGNVSMKKINLVVSGSSPMRLAEFEVYNATGNSSSSVSSSSSSSVSSSSVSTSSSSISSSSSSTSSSVSSSASSTSSVPGGGSSGISNECINLATNPNVNWRQTSLQTDQEIVKCLADTLGRPVGYGENARGGYNPNGNSKLTVITKSGSKSVEQQLLEAIADDNHNWIVFDKFDFAQEHEIGLYRAYCGNATVQSLLDASEAECINYRQWCARKGFNSDATCLTEFFNKAMNKSAIPIRIPVIGSNKTIDGRMSNAFFRFSGFAIGRDNSGQPTQTSNSVILTHLDFRGAGHTEDHYVDPDMIRATGASRHIWIHKNTFDLTGDAAFDVKVGAYDITMSFNKVIDVLRASLHGSSDSRVINTQITTTMHNNAFVTRDARYMTFGNTGRRVPLVRRGTSHMFNNVFMNYRKDVLSLRVGAQVLHEDNMFIVNQAHQEKGTVEASLAELKGNLIRDIGGGSYRSTGGYLWFADAACNLNAATKTEITAASGSVGNLSQQYSAASRNVINAQRISAGQELVDYVSATAGKNGQMPFNSPLAGDRYYVLGLGKVPCQ